MMCAAPIRDCRRTWVSIPLLAVVACTSGPAPDPREGGFIEGVAGLTSGGYQARIEAREQELDQASAERDRLLQRAEVVREERRLVAAQLQSARSRLDSLERDVAALRRSLNAEQNTDAANLAKLRQAEGLLTSTRDRLSAGESSAVNARYDLDKAQEIEGTLDTVAAIVRDLSASTE